MSVFNLGLGFDSAAKDAVAGKDYIVVKDGNGAEFHVLNLDDDKYCPRTGIVEFEPLRTSKRHVNNITISQYRDNGTGFLVGIPLGLDNRTKQIIWQRINVKDRVAYDLSVPRQRAEAIVVMNSFFVKGSPNYRAGGKTVYKKVDMEEEANAFMKNRIIKRKAADIAEALTGESLRDMGYALGKDPKFMSELMLMQEVIRYADEHPKEFMDIYNNDGRHQLTVIKRGLATGVLEQSVDLGITYNGIPLGHSDFEAMDYLKKNPQTLTSIDLQAKKKEELTSKSMSKTFQKEAVQIKDEKDAKLALMEAELEKLRKERDLAASAALKLQSEKDIADVDPELLELQNEAVSLKIQGAKLYKDKEKLRRVIKEATQGLEN
jgi:hypothetical protein